MKTRRLNSLVTKTRISFCSRQQSDTLFFIQKRCFHSPSFKEDISSTCSRLAGLERVLYDYTHTHTHTHGLTSKNNKLALSQHPRCPVSQQMRSTCFTGAQFRCLRHVCYHHSYCWVNIHLTTSLSRWGGVVELRWDFTFHGAAVVRLQMENQGLSLSFLESPSVSVLAKVK